MPRPAETPAPAADDAGLIELQSGLIDLRVHVSPPNLKALRSGTVKSRIARI
jgi:hypothetical protein